MNRGAWIGSQNPSGLVDVPMDKANRKRHSQASKDVWIIRGGAVVMAVGLAVATWAAGLTPSKPEAVEPISIRVEDLDCHVWCPIKIDNAIGNVPGVFDLFVDVDSGVVTAEVDPKKTSRDVLVQKLESRGWVVLEAQSSELGSE